MFALQIPKNKCSNKIIQCAVQFCCSTLKSSSKQIHFIFQPKMHSHFQFSSKQETKQNVQLHWSNVCDDNAKYTTHEWCTQTESKTTTTTTTLCALCRMWESEMKNVRWHKNSRNFNFCSESSENLHTPQLAVPLSDYHNNFMIEWFFPWFLPLAIPYCSFIFKF